jgi:hypothetical protein
LRIEQTIPVGSYPYRIEESLMKAQAVRFLSVAASLVLFLALSHAASAQGDLTLEVQNPRGEVAPTPVLAPSARIPDLAGKKIGIYWNSKAGGDLFWNVVEAQMKEKAPSVKIVRYSGAFEPTDEQIAAMTKEVDGFFYGVGD